MVRRADCTAKMSLARCTGDWVGDRDEKKEGGICLGGGMDVCRWKGWFVVKDYQRCRGGGFQYKKQFGTVGR